jgi:hypothetical protein
LRVLIYSRYYFFVRCVVVNIFNRCLLAVLRSIFIMAALKALSDNFYISVILVLHLLSFSIQVEIFLDK